MGNITFFVIFAVLDVSLAVNLCINCSFFLHLFYLMSLRRENSGIFFLCEVSYNNYYERMYFHAAFCAMKLTDGHTNVMM